MLYHSFTLMDPLGLMPLFLNMTEGRTEKERHAIALEACVITFSILVLFALSGRWLFQFFGLVDKK